MANGLFGGGAEHLRIKHTRGILTSNSLYKFSLQALKSINEALRGVWAFCSLLSALQNTSGGTHPPVRVKCGIYLSMFVFLIKNNVRSYSLMSVVKSFPFGLCHWCVTSIKSKIQQPHTRRDPLVICCKIRSRYQKKIRLVHSPESRTCQGTSVWSVGSDHRTPRRSKPREPWWSISSTNKLFTSKYEPCHSSSPFHCSPHLLGSRNRSQIYFR